MVMQGRGDSNASPGQTAAEGEAMMREPQKQTQGGCVHALPVCTMLGELVDRSYQCNRQHHVVVKKHRLGAKLGAGSESYFHHFCSG